MIIRKDSIVINGILLIQLVLYIEFLFTGNANYVYANGAVGLIGLIYYLLTCENKKRNHFFIVLVSFVLIALVGMIFHRYYSFVNIVREILTYLTTGFLLSNKALSRKFSLFAFYAVFVVIVIALLQTGYPYYIFASNSRNYISVVLLIMMVPYYIACRNDSITPSLIPTICTMVCSIYVLGRGGIICTTVLFIVTLIYRIINTNGDKRHAWIVNGRYLLLAIMVAVIAVIILKKTNVMDEYLYRFMISANYDGSRFSIWSEYFEQLNSHPFCWLIGLNFNNSYYLNNYLNAHNSFLMLHSYMTIIGLIAGVYVIVQYFKLNIKTKTRSGELLILIFAILLRSSLDWVFTFHMGDIILFFMIGEIINIKFDDVYRMSN